MQFGRTDRTLVQQIESGLLECLGEELLDSSVEVSVEPEA